MAINKYLERSLRFWTDQRLEDAIAEMAWLESRDRTDEDLEWLRALRTEQERRDEYPQDDPWHDF